jgi:hypothetical protein
MSYNGHTNYETWSIHVHDLPEVFAEIARDCGEYEVTATMISEWFDEMFESEMPVSPLLLQLLNGAISDIDWYSLAESVNEYLKELQLQTA